jgi:predicted O-methyltransferase YrrM
MDSLEKIIAERPTFHQPETEVQRTFDITESFLDPATSERLRNSALTCYSMDPAVLRFLADAVGQESRTLETGAGSSTLLFALRRASHIAVTPSAEEVDRIRKYASENEIALDTVTFVVEPSERYLPRCDAEGLDLVLLDGKHAFPWPIVDWFYTVERLRCGGLLVLDDAHLRSVRLLTEFMSAESGWRMANSFSSGRTVVFQKVEDRVLDVAWHMQRWTVMPDMQTRNALSSAIARRVRWLLRR